MCSSTTTPFYSGLAGIHQHLTNIAFFRDWLALPHDLYNASSVKGRISSPATLTDNLQASELIQDTSEIHI